MNIKYPNALAYIKIEAVIRVKQKLWAVKIWAKMIWKQPSSLGRLIQSNEKKPLHSQKTPKSKVTTQSATKNFDYTTIADRLRTISWSDDSSLNCVVKPVYGTPTFPLTTKAV